MSLPLYALAVNYDGELWHVRSTVVPSEARALGVTPWRMKASSIREGDGPDGWLATRLGIAMSAHVTRCATELFGAWEGTEPLF